MADERAGSLLREARSQAGLTQAQLARRAGVSQSVVSAYESASRQPSLPMLARLVAATGLELELLVRRPRGASEPTEGPVRSRLYRYRRQVREIAERHGLSNVRVFGSVARDEDTDESDVDLLVDVAPGVGMLGLARCQHELQVLLDAPVDLVPAGDLKAGVANSVLRDSTPL